ncbi:hypothetical protein G6F35_017930 [Rhizopus arrhizus]|nr:hypothetical protein G6F35_017930 [Rhizopus arrhizus]
MDHHLGPAADRHQLGQSRRLVVLGAEHVVRRRGLGVVHGLGLAHPDPQRAIRHALGHNLMAFDAVGPRVLANATGFAAVIRDRHHLACRPDHSCHRTQSRHQCLAAS